jgi:hypothetical protein
MITVKQVSRMVVLLEKYKKQIYTSPLSPHKAFSQQW